VRQVVRRAGVQEAGPVCVNGGSGRYIRKVERVVRQAKWRQVRWCVCGSGGSIVSEPEAAVQ